MDKNVRNWDFLFFSGGGHGGLRAVNVFDLYRDTKQFTTLNFPMTLDQVTVGGWVGGRD